MTMIPNNLDGDYPPMSIDEALGVLCLIDPMTPIFEVFDTIGPNTTAIQTLTPDWDFIVGRHNTNFCVCATTTIQDVINNGLHLRAKQNRCNVTLRP